MRSITVAVDDDTYKRARIAAAERDTSVSALVKDYLEQLASHETETERRKRQERARNARPLAWTDVEGRTTCYACGLQWAGRCEARRFHRS